MNVKYPNLLIVFVIFSLFHNIYISIFISIFDYNSTPFAVIFKTIIILIGLIMIVSRKIVFTKELFFIFSMFIISFLVISINLILNPYYILWDIFYYVGYTFFIIIFITVVIGGYKNTVNLDYLIFYNLLVIGILSLFLGEIVNHRLQLKSLNPITVGSFGGFLFLISLWNILFLKLNETVRLKFILSILGILIGSYILYASGSRGPLLGSFLAILFFFYNYYFNKFQKFLKYVIILLFIISPIFLFYLSINIPDLKVFTQRDIGLRGYFYLSFYEGLINNPIFPTIHPRMIIEWMHSIFLAIYAGSGIFGFVIFCYMIVSILKDLSFLIKNKDENCWISLFFIQILIVSTFSGALIDANFWIVFSLTIAYLKKYKKTVVKNVNKTS